MRNRKLTRKEIEARLAPIRPKNIAWMAKRCLMKQPAWKQEIMLEAVEQMEFATLADCWTKEHMALARKYNTAVRSANSLATRLNAMFELPHIAQLIEDSKPEQETK